jgi:hypothetical protein
MIVVVVVVVDVVLASCPAVALSFILFNIYHKFLKFDD